MSNTKTIEKIALPASLRQAIGEQQDRVWRLRNLIECVRNTADSSEDVEDFGAAITGLQDYADDTFYALDAGAVAERAHAIDEKFTGGSTVSNTGSGSTVRLLDAEIPLAKARSMVDVLLEAAGGGRIGEMDSDSLEQTLTIVIGYLDEVKGMLFPEVEATSA
jgi:hypothetical protein